MAGGSHDSKRQLLTAAVVVLALVVLVPVGLWLGSGHVAWLLLLPVLLLLLLAAILILGLWGSHGGLPALLAGQREPRPKHFERDISVTGGEVPVVPVRVTVDLGRPVAEISERYLTYAFVQFARG
jgi:hypothetical protein